MPATFPCAYAWLPVRPCNGTRVSPCGISVQAPAAKTPGADVAMRSSTITPPVEPIFKPAAAASALLGSLWVHTTARSAGISPSEVCTARRWPSPRNASSVVLKCALTPSSRQDSSTGSMMSGSAISDIGHGPGSTRCVSIPRCAKAVVISTPSGDAGVGIVEPGGQHQTVPGHVLPVDVDDLAGDVDAADPGFVADIDAGLNVGLLGGKKKPLEVVDLLAVDVRNAAGAVGNVLELGEHHDLVAWVGCFQAARRADAGGAATYDYDLARHAFMPPWLVERAGEPSTMIEVSSLSSTPLHRQGERRDD